MFYEKELQFLCDTFKKCRVETKLVSSEDSVGSVISTDIYAIFGRAVDGAQNVGRFLGELERGTVYKMKNPFEFCYTYLKLPTAASTNILFIGPYLSEPIKKDALLELGERIGVSPKEQRYLEEYYMSIPVLTDGSPLFIILGIFCERIFDAPSFSVVDVTEERAEVILSAEREASHREHFEDAIVNVKAMEKRYAFENEMIDAVRLGQIHKESLLNSAFSEELFEKRVSDPLRNAKNYAIIMNTLLRKAAEEGGVHPIYIDKLSSDLALKIEQMASASSAGELMSDMFRSYCRLVRKHSVSRYSPAVQKAILLIDLDLAADLSLSSLASEQNISAGYLSAIFKKETGKTVSEYIRERRIEYAEQLLATTHLQVQTVALHCGIMDSQYFSKLFKRHTGKTPKEYRDQLRARGISKENDEKF